jgi:hypothetical protein
MELSWKEKMFLQNLKTMDVNQLKWVIDHDIYSEWHKENAQEELKKRLNK